MACMKIFFNVDPYFTIYSVAFHGLLSIIGVLYEAQRDAIWHICLSSSPVRLSHLPLRPCDNG
jgi:hypothetical protein